MESFCRRGIRNLQRGGFSVVRLKAGLRIVFRFDPPLGIARGGLLAHVPPVGGTQCGTRKTGLQAGAWFRNRDLEEIGMIADGNLERRGMIVTRFPAPSSRAEATTLARDEMRTTDG